MKTYRIKITEKLERIIEVEADNEELALSKAEDLYAAAQVVLDSSHHVITEFLLEE